MIFLFLSYVKNGAFFLKNDRHKVRREKQSDKVFTSKRFSHIFETSSERKIRVAIRKIVHTRTGRA